MTMMWTLMMTVESRLDYYFDNNIVVVVVVDCGGESGDGCAASIGDGIDYDDDCERCYDDNDADCRSCSHLEHSLSCSYYCCYYCCCCI